MMNDQGSYHFAADLTWVGASIASTIGMDGPKVNMSQYSLDRQVLDWSRPRVG